MKRLRVGQMVVIASAVGLLAGQCPAVTADEVADRVEIAAKELRERMSFRNPDEVPPVASKYLGGYTDGEIIRGIDVWMNRAPLDKERVHVPSYAGYLVKNDPDLIKDSSELRKLIIAEEDPQRFYLLSCFAGTFLKRGETFIPEMSHMLFRHGSVEPPHVRFYEDRVGDVSKFTHEYIVGILESLHAPYDENAMAPNGYAPMPARIKILVKWLRANWPGCEHLGEGEALMAEAGIDDPTEIKLYPVNGGYESKSQALVSGEIDAEIPTLENITTNNPEPTSRHKRTHNIQLGGKVRITNLVIDGIAIPVELKTPVPIKKTVRLKFVVINDAETPDIAAELKSANEIYASTGIKLESAGAPVTRSPLPGLPNQSSASELNYLDISDLGRYISHYGATDSIEQIYVFYVRRVGYFVEGSANMLLAQGVSLIEKSPGTMSGAPTPSAKETGDAINVFIGNTRASFMVLAHELAHVFTNDGHYGTEYSSDASNRKESHNLMSGTNRNHLETNSMTAKKGFTKGNAK